MTGAVFNQNVGTVEQGGQLIGAQYNAPVTINQGATIDQIVEALRNAGILTRLTSRIPEVHFRKLLDIVGRVKLDEAKQLFSRIYHASLPPTVRVLNTNLPSRLLIDLCDQPNIKEWPPLFEFVERLRLAEGIDSALVKELQQWVDMSAGVVVPSVPAAEIARLRKEVHAEKARLNSETWSWLQVYLEPDWLNRTQERKQPLFMVELVLWSPMTNGPLVLQAEEAPQATGVAKRLWTLDELPSLLDRAFANPEYVHKIPYKLNLVIEVVAPSEVLLYSFERWQRNNSSHVYGMYHPVVVRLRDRLTIPNPIDQAIADEYWRQKWDAFKLNLCRNGCEELEWLGEAELSDVFKLQDNAELACLGLAFPLCLDNGQVFEVLRDSGIPIALWLRGTDLGLSELADLPERMKLLIKGNPLSDLYRAVQSVRRSAEVRRDLKHIGNAITLLWDDPDRVPPKYQERGVFV